MPASRRRPHSPRSIRRAKTSSPDTPLSPFILDLSQLHLPATHLPTDKSRFKATWLHTPVLVRQVSSKAQALAHATLMSNLRHPNLEQFLGAVVDPAMPCIVTEYVPGPSLSHLLRAAEHKRTKFVPRHAFNVALDISRALLYFHATCRHPHGAVGPRTILYDDARCKAVLLMSGQLGVDPPCAAPETRLPNAHIAFAADVYSLAAVMVLMFGKSESLPTGLAQVVVRCLSKDWRKRPRMEELCQSIMDCCDT